MRDLVYFLKFLYGAIGFRIFVWVAFIGAAAILDGLTVGLFLPILGGEDFDSGITRAITDAFAFFGMEYRLSLVIAFMVLFYLLRTGFLIFQEIYAKRIVTRILVQLKCGLVDKLFKVDYRYFVRNEVGYFTNAVTIEYSNVAFAFETCMTIIVAVGFAAVYFAIPLAVNPALTAAVMVLSIPAYFVLMRVNRLTREYSMNATENNARLQSYLIQAFHNFKYLKATASDSGILGKVYAASERQGDIYFKQSMLGAFMSKSTELVLLLLVAAFLFYQAVFLGINLLAVLFLLFLLRRAVTHSLTAQQAYRKFLSVSGSIRVFQRLEKELAENREDLLDAGVTPDFSGTIKFQDVSMTYDGSTEVLNKVNLEIPPRKTVAIVGSSGAGKSTLVTLLTGILKPTGGKVMLGDTSYAEINQRALRHGIGYVTQETVIFNDSIRNNITLSDNSVPDEPVMAAANRAFLKEFIEGLPEGYDTLMGDDGINVSGGQRQRISIARELFKDAKLLIFDEATSSLDSHSEREIQRNIDSIRGEKTVVLIAHRLSTIRDSDTIFVLNNGRIEEQGTYDELYAKGGLFKAMVDQQALSDPSGGSAAQANGDPP